MISTTLGLAALSALLLEATFVSALSEAERCTDAPDACEAPLSCVGNPQNMKCFMKKSLGMVCGKDPFWVCEEGLVCDDDICRREVREAGACNAVEDACIPPLSCVGNPQNMKCFMKKSLGMVCGKDPFWVCEEGLVCDDDICRREVREAGACNAVEDACIPPLSCVGNPQNMKCFMKKGLGMVCGKDPFWVCEEGLMCDDGICSRPVAVGGSCNAVEEVCTPPLSCVGNQTDRKCFTKKALNMACGESPFSVCEEGLMCINSVCKIPVRNREACNDPDTGCIPPKLFCVGNEGDKKCFKRKFRGMTCDTDPFWVCADHLVCDEGICKKPMSVRGRCDINNQICMPPLSCEGTPELKRCVMKKGVGMICGKDPFWICEDGLECVDFRCQVI